MWHVEEMHTRINFRMISRKCCSQVRLQPIQLQEADEHSVTTSLRVKAENKLYIGKRENGFLSLCADKESFKSNNVAAVLKVAIRYQPFNTAAISLTCTIQKSMRQKCGSFLLKQPSS